MKELIEQIGGRERLEAIVYAMGAEPCDADPILDSVTHGDIGKMARALLAVLDAKPLGYIDPESMREYRGVMAGGSWSAAPRGGEYNQTMPIYTTPPAASAPDGWKLVPVEPTWDMLSADGCKEHPEGKKCLHHDNRRRIWAAMLAAAPAPGGDHAKQG